MKRNKLYKKIMAFICSLALVVTSMTGMAGLSVKAADDIFVDGAVKDFGTVSEYAYNYGWLCEADSQYQYMIITYTGDITNLRIQEVKGEDRLGSLLWMDQTQDSRLTLVGDAELVSEKGATVVVDLKASGFNLDECDAMDMHYGPGTLNIGYVRLSTSPEITEADVMPEPVDPPQDLEDIELTGIEGVWAPAEGTPDGAYVYLTGMDVNAPAGYAYLMLAYTGDATAFKDFRIELAGMGTIGLGEKPYDGAAVDWLGEAVPAPTEEVQYVMIDLAASGMDITKAISNIHLHTSAGNGSFEIVEAWLCAPYAEEELEDLTVEGLKNVWEPAEDAADGAYAYLGGIDVNAPEGYNYLKLTYKGDATAFNDFRMEFTGIGTVGFGKNAYDGAAVTVDGEAVAAPTEEEQTVIIDLWATGLDFDKAITAIHLHQTAGNGSFEITDAVLMQYYIPDVDPSTLEDIILNGDEKGASSMIKEWNVKKPAAGTQYKYLGFATLKEPTFDYRYLILTYAGDIGSVRFEFAYVDENGNETAKTSPYWFNKEGQELYMVTADGSDVPLDGGKGTTVVIDLWETGIDLDEYNSVHMHAGYGEEGKDIYFKIGMARLSTSADINEALDVMPTIVPDLPEEPATKAPETTTAQPATVKAKTPARAKIRKVNAKKKAAKVVKLSLKKTANAKGYQVQISTTKKFKKVLVKKFTKKLKVSVKSKKLKNKKKLYVRVRAYNLNGKTKVYGKFSKVKKIKIKK